MCIFHRTSKDTHGPNHVKNQCPDKGAPEVEAEGDEVCTPVPSTSRLCALRRPCCGVAVPLGAFQRSSAPWGCCVLTALSADTEPFTRCCTVALYPKPNPLVVFSFLVVGAKPIFDKYMK